MKKERYYLGIEFGSTRIKGAVLDCDHQVVSKASYQWASTCENGYWTYPLSQALDGLRCVLSQLDHLDELAAFGVSGMMHGYLAFDANWNLLVPFRTWQNTTTGPAAAALTSLFHFNIPQRWSIAHLYQAILNQEEHASKVRHITTLAGYVHFLLTGVNAIGIGEASGMFPVDQDTHSYDAVMIRKFDRVSGLDVSIQELLPKVLIAGEPAGFVTSEGSRLTNGLLQPGLAAAPCEGDAGTGMVATDAVVPCTGNVSGGTSIFLMAVLEHSMVNVHPEIDVVATPAGSPVAMVHCNNCTAELNQWVSMFQELLAMEGVDASSSKLFEDLYRCSMDGESSGITMVNYLTGEGVTHMDDGFPMILRKGDRKLSLAQFMRAQLYSSIATLALGMNILKTENVNLQRLMAHGGIFKTEGVMDRYLASALSIPVSTMKTAGEGGPCGMALLAQYLVERQGDEPLSVWLDRSVFAHVETKEVLPDPVVTEDFEGYLSRFCSALEMERSVIEKRKKDHE